MSAASAAFPDGFFRDLIKSAASAASPATKKSFKLVEIYGDEGGASMLAGSISKALITTAIGLIIAIPTLGIYHVVKYRLNCLSDLLEEELEALLNAWLLTDEVSETSDNETK